MKWMGVVLLLASPAASQGIEDGPERFAEGLERMLRDLFSDMEPVLRDLRDTIEDLDQYEAPELLPNGDILIRRKTPLDPPPDTSPDIGPDTAPSPDEPEIEMAPEDPIDL